MSSPDYYFFFNGLAVTQHSEGSFITYCLTSSFILLYAFLLVMYFKDGILQTFLCIVDSIHHIFLHVTYIFNTLYGLCTIWKELKQLQPQEQYFQQPKTSKLLVQVSPPPGEYLTKVREQLTISSSPEQELFRTFNRNAVTLRYFKQNNYYFYTPLMFL